MVLFFSKCKDSVKMALYETLVFCFSVDLNFFNRYLFVWKKKKSDWQSDFAIQPSTAGMFSQRVDCLELKLTKNKNIRFLARALSAPDFSSSVCIR